jgi:hypothetical protein
MISPPSRSSSGWPLATWQAASLRLEARTAYASILDEATELGDEIIDLALPVTAARPEARFLFASTGGAPVGRAFETYMAGLDVGGQRT